MKIKASSVEEYLENIPENRKESINKVREIILDNLPQGYDEVLQYGMLSYVIPLTTYPKTYNKQPLAYISLGNQKNYISLYLNSVYSSEEKSKSFVEEYKATGKKLNMGKSCVRFKTLDDLPMELVAKTVKDTSVKEFITLYEKVKPKRK